MKNKSTPYLDYYKKWMETGELPNNGLCNSLSQPIDFGMYFMPTDEDLEELLSERCSCIYFTSGLQWDCDEIDKKELFTPLRQTIVLLLAAMNDEL